LRISNDASDYTLIGASDVESATNTRIAMYGNTRAGYAGIIEYITTSTGYHTFLTGGTGTTYGTEKMRIASNGNIGIGTNNPVYRYHFRTTYDVISTGFHLDADDDGGNPNKYALTIYPYVIPGGGAVGWRFRTQSLTGGTNTPFALNNSGCVLFKSNVFHRDDNNKEVFYLSSDSKYYLLGSTTANGSESIIFRSGNHNAGFIMYDNGNYSARGSLQAWSDIRIKKDIEDIIDDTALQMILAIEPKTYKYIDGNKSKERVYGFIAQQVKEVIPEAVVLVDNIIPNIYKNCICEDNKRVYIVLPQEVLGVHIKLSDYGNYKITKIESDYIEVEDDMNIGKVIPDGEQFVYGYEVKDFHTINKEYIFTLNVCATHELHRRIEAQNVVIKSHEDRIKDLETKMERMLSGNT
jgi:hypothetical protein